MIELKKITLLSDDMPKCIDLNIPEDKDDYLISNAEVLAWAYDWNYAGKITECRAIYARDEMVGLICYNYYIGDPIFKETCYRIRPVMVDEGHLDKGYEVAALERLLEEIRTKPHGNAAAIFATYDPEEKDMAELYASVGFIKTDLNWDAEDPDDNDIIVRMNM
ncbi:MAG: hypothetical protein FWC95_04940 [Defluviitaleaceae bacterium]|nr:hypothetical protein [Defluviitaleaceae bacterium]